MIELSKIEQDLAREIINIGLAKSADSLSFFTQQKVLIRSIDVEIKQLSAEDFGRRSVSGDSYLLTTEIKGELEGVCYLIFSEPDVENIVKSCLPGLKGDLKGNEMAEGLLMEIDNILSASVITQFSNLLKLSMYGGVPKLDVLNQEELKTAVLRNQDQRYYLSFRACFEPDSINVNPEFIWLLNEEFVLGVKKIISESTFSINEHI
jgi:chemotaxis protein CheY-P-specific phosphatase CheC